MRGDGSREVSKATGRRLVGRERLALALITVFSLAVTAVALLKGLGAWVTFFGEQVTRRDAAIAGQAFRTALWGIATPFCAWMVLRRGPSAWLGAAAWLALLGWTQWWQWPPRPIEGADSDDPIWLSSSALLWAFVVLGAGTGFYAAWRSGLRSSKVAAVVLAGMTLSIGAASHIDLVRHKNEERSVPSADGAVELRDLRSDRIWSALPGRVRVERDRAAARAIWGERLPTTRSVELGTFDDHELFRDAVAAAERSGWVLVSTFCHERSWDARFQKNLAAGQARLRISVAAYLRAVHVFAEMTPETSPGDPRKCWGD